MAPTPIAIRLAQTLGITTSAYLAGSILSISYFSVPSFLLAPSPILARQWQLCFDRGKIINPAISLVSAFSYAWLSYKLYGTLNHPKAEIYAISAIFTLGIFPYTIIGIMPTNKKLFKKHAEMKGMSVEEKSTEAGLGRGESTKELVDRRGMLNLGRGALPLVGAVLGLWATLD